MNAEQPAFGGGRGWLVARRPEQPRKRKERDLHDVEVFEALAIALLAEGDDEDAALFLAAADEVRARADAARPENYFCSSCIFL